MKFTKNEIAILMHRLEMPDCISESEDMPLDGTQLLCEALIANLKASGTLPNDLTLTNTISPNTRRVMLNAAGGSTFCAAMNLAYNMNEISIQKRTAYWNAAASLGRKLNLNVPTS